MGFQASCPACGSPVEFTLKNSIVAICPSCATACGRGDGSLENLGKVADLVQTDSPLDLGMRGRFKGVGFEIVGRTQIQHSAGGLWDEWYVAFKGGARWGWLAEAQGRFFLTFETTFPKSFNVPGRDELEIDDELVLPKYGAMAVAEVGQGEILGAAGQIPYPLKPGTVYDFADLSGSGKKFATIDWSAKPPKVFVGGEVTLKQLELHDAAARANEVRKVQALQVNCPKCAGSLELQAPDEALRVTCPWCASLLDCDHGNLKYLKALKAKPVKPYLPPGTKGTIDPAWIGEDWGSPREYTVIGFVQRCVVYEGLKYFWHEYLLYCPRQPFAWLILNNGHWNFGQSVGAGEVSTGPKTALYNGQTYSIYDRSVPRVTWVQGEFYWKIEVGEKVQSSDFIKPPRMLSREVSTNPDAGSRGPEGKRDRKNREINYTVAHYVPGRHIVESFKLDNKPVPSGVAPNQPFPYSGIYKQWGLLLLIAFGIFMFVAMTKANRTHFVLPAKQLQPGEYTILSDHQLTTPLNSGENIQISVTASQWVYVEGEFIETKTGKRIPFSVTSGNSVYLSPPPAGDYRLRLGGRWRTSTQASPTFTVRVRQDVLHFTQFVVTLVLLSIIPVLTIIYHVSFSKRRWEDSEFSPFNSE